ncbi:TPA: hypothetical protein ACH3X2_005964 [Trebouxia sp. C0005]
MQPSHQANEAGLHQAATSYSIGSHTSPPNISQAYPLPSQPLQLRPAYQQQIPQQPALANASHPPQYQPQGTHSAWQPSVTQQPRQHAPLHQVPPQLAYSSAPQSSYAQQQQQQYPHLHHAHSQNAIAGRADMPAQSAAHSHQQGATMQTASSATQHAQAAAGTPGTSAGRGFTHNQLNVLRNQILAFRRIKRGDKILPADLMQGIKAPPADGSFVPLQGTASSAASRPMTQPMRPPGQVASRVAPQAASAQGALLGQARPQMALQYTPQQQLPVLEVQAPVGKDRGPIFTAVSAPRGGGQFVPQRPPMGQLPLMQLGYDAAQLMAQEYRTMTIRRRQARIADLESQLATNPLPGFHQVDGKMGKGKLLLELRMLKLADEQARLRAAVEKEQEDVQGLSERNYRKLVRNCLRQRIEAIKQDERKKADMAGERSRMIKLFRSTLQERSNYSRESRLARNRAVSKTHERLARDAHKAKDDDKGRRMDALKAHDWQAYQELLAKQKGPEGASERYEVINRFLDDTEDYLHKLAGKVASVKLSQEASEAAAQAMAEARAQGMTEEEVQAAATQAMQETTASSDAAKSSTASLGDAQSRYYSLAHSVEEVVRSQPSMLKPPSGAKLRQYQMVGLQWMVSLYNNHLNGILADEMGLGKTVQVMALLAYLMEHKNNYGPHLIIVPNAVMVNWKSELNQWLPSVRCVYYVGQKEERARKFAQEVSSLQFNVLVTTYEYIMRDRAKLSKVEWKYVIIDEAQRMKDRQSKLARDLDRFTTLRRLLLTGTPLQNELQELWSLLNLLLPEVFDDKNQFAEWFGDSFGKTAPGAGGEDDVAMEKRVVVIHRLHQILEPFMLRRQVQDVEGKLPPKVALTVHVAMTAYQSVVYDWVKATGTLRLSPFDPRIGKSHRHNFAPLNNKCMELRKVCNHPALSYPPDFGADQAELLRQCGKLCVLDRLLIKLHRTGHRVLLFSTMTRLLDLLEGYLRWRRFGAEGAEAMQYARIDGGTALEDRETAIKRFNAPNSEVFIFLLSIRAAGRGLNLQTADTVVVYDPDPNPKNEEQAIARAHRIGQTKEVRVIHFEAVADAPDDSMYDAQAAYSTARKRRYADSIESLVRNNIQKMKIDMANEVIDAGRFDMQTSMEERKQTLEALLQDEENLQRAHNEVPTDDELNMRLARGPAELATFRAIDAEMDATSQPMGMGEVPEWLLFDQQDVHDTLVATSKHKPHLIADMAAMANVPGLANGQARRPVVLQTQHYASQAAQDRQARGVKRSADVLLKDEEDQRYQAAQQSMMQQPEVSGITESHTEDGNEDPLGDEDDMEEEVVDANLADEGTNTGQGNSSRAVSDAPSVPGHGTARAAKQANRSRSITPEGGLAAQHYSWGDQAEPKAEPAKSGWQGFQADDSEQKHHTGNGDGQPDAVPSQTASHHAAGARDADGNDIAAQHQPNAVKQEHIPSVDRPPTKRTGLKVKLKFKTG